MTILTALMHLAFSPMFMDDDLLGLIKLGIGFIINGIGYFLIIVLLSFTGAIAENKNRLKMVLGGWTIGSIVGWLLFHPGSYLDSSLLNKVIEVILLVFLFLESREATTT